MNQVWTLADMPSLTGRVAVVTGSTDGLGRQVAARLADGGATVVLAGRNTERGRAAAAAVGRGSVFLTLDLASLASVRAFAAAVSGRFQRLDLLINNAGVAMIPRGR